MTLSNNDGPGPPKESLDERKGEESSYSAGENHFAGKGS
jgi:hypothetical protein